MFKTGFEGSGQNQLYVNQKVAMMDEGRVRSQEMHDVNEGSQKGKHLVCREGRGFSWRFSHHLLPTKETAGSQMGGVAPGC